MPNADGFIVDDRAETEYRAVFAAEPCMENCKDSVEITMRAAGAGRDTRTPATTTQKPSRPIDDR